MNDETEFRPDAPRRGRPPKAVNEQERTIPNNPQDTVTVTLVRGYVPRDAVPNADGIYFKHWPGEEIELSMREAMHLVSKGIAKMEMSDD